MKITTTIGEDALEINTGYLTRTKELSKKDFRERAELHWSDPLSLEEHYMLIGSGPEIKEEDLKKIKVTKGCYLTSNIFKVFWHRPTKKEHLGTKLRADQWLIVFTKKKKKDAVRYVPKYIVNKEAYTGEV